MGEACKESSRIEIGRTICATGPVTSCSISSSKSLYIRRSAGSSPSNAPATLRHDEVSIPCASVKHEVRWPIGLLIRGNKEFALKAPEESQVIRSSSLRIVLKAPDLDTRGDKIRSTMVQRAESIIMPGT